MRLWHKALIEVLPRQQLLGQWRELNSIYKKQDKHILINFIYDYDITDIIWYSTLVYDEMIKRGYKCDTKNFKKRYSMTMETAKCVPIPYNTIFKNKMNERYLKQCLYNLQEKYDCGGISQEEWQKIEDKFGGVM
jgi:uncharacterized protein (TIGR02328 family)